MIIATCDNKVVGVRHITFDCVGNIYEVPKMFNKFGQETKDPALASTCVVMFDNDYIEQDADDVPIYTVH